jgi:hypothetical protein
VYPLGGPQTIWALWRRKNISCSHWQVNHEYQVYSLVTTLTMPSWLHLITMAKCINCLLFND